MPRLRRHSSSAPSPPARIVLLSGVAVVLLIAFLWAGLNAPNSIPGRRYYTVTAQLKDAGNLTAHTQVRAAGKLVGQVLHPRYEDGHAVVELQLDEALRPLRSDASARIRPRSAVGSPYLELSPGRADTPLPAGAVLPAARSSAAVPVDEVLSALDARTRARTRVLLEQLGRGTTGRGDDLNGVLGGTPGVERDVRAAAAPLLADPSAVPALLGGGASVLDAVAPLSEEVATGWRPGGEVLDALHQRAALTRALALAPAALPAVQRGLARTDPLLAAADRFAVRGLPVLRRAPAALRQTGAMLSSADEHVGALQRTLRQGRDAVSPALGLLGAVQPLLPRVDTAMSATRPIVDELAPRRCDMLLLTDNWASMMSNGNADGNVLRLAIVTAGFNSLNGIQSPAIQNPGTHKSPYPAPCITKTQKATP